MSGSYPYSQPSLTRLLVLTSFLYLLNVVRVVADYALHAGLVAELFLGIVYGAPLASILSQEWEATFNVVGYLGLVCIVFEGGLSTNLPVLLSNLPLSCLCALTGIALPIALSFALLVASYGYRPLEAFAAGAALSSTSLGTTLAALNAVSKGVRYDTKKHDSEKEEGMASEDNPEAGRAAHDDLELVSRASGVRSASEQPGPNRRPRSSSQSSSLAHDPISPNEPQLQQTRIGTVLISAAIIDDVVGLVIAALIPALAILNDSSSSPGSTSRLPWTLIRPLLSSLLIALVSPLVARFVLRPLFWYRAVGERWCAPRRANKRWGWSQEGSRNDGSAAEWGSEAHADAVKVAIMVCVVSAFAAIAYYTGSSILFGSYVAGLTLSYIAKPPENEPDTPLEITLEERAGALSFEHTFARNIGPLQQYILAPLFFASIGYGIPFLSLWKPRILWRGVVYSVLMCIGKLAVGLPIVLWSTIPLLFQNLSRREKPRGPLPRTTPVVPPPHTPPIPRPRPSVHVTMSASLYPAVFIGVAMVSRGEIGLLIAQVARGSSDGSSDSQGSEGLLSEDTFLVCIWAILLCTLIGPISVGIVVRRWGAKVTAGKWT